MAQATENRIKLAQREMRATAGGLQFIHQRAPRVSADAFAQTIKRRYEGRMIGHRSLEMMLLRQAQVGVVSHHLHHQTHALLTPRLNLTIFHHSPHSTPPGFVRADDLTHRLLSRGARTEMPVMSALVTETYRETNRAAKRGGGDEAASWLASPPRPVPVVVRRLVAASGESTETDQGAVTPRPDRQPISAARSVTGNGAVDLDRLTNDVIQAIDRRIIAQRERLGRM